MIYNPRGDRDQGAGVVSDTGPLVRVGVPGSREALPDALSEFARDEIDLLVISGGDGTVRDVLTCGDGIFGDNWPAIAILPKGKTNALTVDLGVPIDWNLQDAIEAFDKGGRMVRRPSEVSDLE